MFLLTKLLLVQFLILIVRRLKVIIILLLLMTISIKKTDAVYNNYLLINLGNRIRQLRKSKNLSQEDFADLVGLDRTYIGGIERGERNVALINLVKIATSLNMTVSELLRNIDMPKNSFISKIVESSNSK